MDVKKILIVLFSLVLLFAFFYPKERVVGGLRGFVHVNQTAYREDYDCFGVPYDFCPPWPDYGCDYLCYGIVFNKQCFNQTVSGKTRVPCR